jgi:hypothetical protein
MKKIKKILKIIVLSPVFLIGMLFLILGSFGVATFILGETIMKKIVSL